jgi:hypothetical protein
MLMPAQNVITPRHFQGEAYLSTFAVMRLQLGNVLVPVDQDGLVRFD